MHWGNREMYGILLAECPPKKGDKIFEAGFGGGMHIDGIIGLSDNLSYSGIDLSRSMVKMASRYNRRLIDKKIVDLAEGDLNNIPYPASAFDMVLTINTIYFWADPRQVITELARVLKPGGTITIGANSQEEMIKQGYNVEYFNFWNREEIEELVNNNGLEVITSFHRKLKIEDCIGIIAKKLS